MTQEGVYRINYDDLGYYGQAYGINPGQIAPKQIHLYNQGQEVAVYVYGEEDGRFGSGDYVEFYGVPVGPGDQEYKYTEENIYWLKVNTDPPARMASWESPGGGTSQTSFLSIPSTLN